MNKKKAQTTKSGAEKAVSFLQSLEVCEGPRAGRKLKLAPFQVEFIKNALAKETAVACLSVARGSGKSALSAGLALGALVGAFDTQPRRSVIIAARTRDQAAVAWGFAAAFVRSLPAKMQAGITVRRGSKLEIEFAAPDGPHLLRAIAADGKNALGMSPTFAILDERGHWQRDQGDELEAALLSALGKRSGKALIISTSASDDSHPFSQWLDRDQEGVFRQEHRPAPGLPADDLESLLVANPGAAHGIGSSVEWLQAQARRAIARGGSALTSFRLLNRNERVSGEARDVLLTVDQWLACETDTAPPRTGKVIIGLDLGGSASMSAASFFWPETGRLESRGWFPGSPSLLDRGQGDGIGPRYVEMSERGELSTLGDKTTPVAEWIGAVMAYVAGQDVAAIVADRYKFAEISEGLDKAQVRVPVTWRGMGYRDGSEDIERFRRAVFDGQVRSAPSLLLRSAMADAVCLRDPSNNVKLAKARSTGKIDAVCASVLCIAEGARQSARPARKARVQWA